MENFKNLYRSFAAGAVALTMTAGSDSGVEGF